jgi:hypothetical protein
MQFCFYKKLTVSNKKKYDFYFILLYKVMFDKIIFLSLENYQNGLEGVFVKHPLSPKKFLTKSYSK